MLSRFRIQQLAVAYTLTIAGLLAGASIALRASARHTERLAGVQ